MKIIKTLKEARELRPNESYVVDVTLPEKMETDADIKKVDKAIEERNKIVEAVNDSVAKMVLKVWSTDDLVKDMKAEAKLRGIEGYSNMKEAELIKALNA